MTVTICHYYLRAVSHVSDSRLRNSPIYLFITITTVCFIVYIVGGGAPSDPASWESRRFTGLAARVARMLEVLHRPPTHVMLIDVRRWGMADDVLCVTMRRDIVAV